MLPDSDPVQACILSIATNHSAEADSITRPHVGAQRELIDRVVREAGLSGSSISYAEMHGTGTQVSYSDRLRYHLVKITDTFMT